VTGPALGDGTAFPKLFSPLRVGPITLRNRIVNLPQGMAYTNRGRVEEEDVEYHRRRAAGGAGLVITGGTAVAGSSQSRTRNFVEAYDPAVVDGVRRRSEAVHAGGAHIVGQLFDLGREMAAEAMTDTPISPTALRAPGARYAPMAMTSDQITGMVDSFRLSARHFAQGGCDGVEIHAAHGYLLAQFLSPASNRRDDGYGGDAVRRARALIDTVRAVRAEVGDDVLVGVRLSVDDELAGGTDPAQCRETIDLLLDAVAVDYLSLAVGAKGTYVQDSSVPEGVALDRIGAVTRGLAVPSVASQRIRRPEQAEQLLVAGVASLVGMARALIADPDWPRKAADGRPDRIRRCVGAMQDCRSHLAGGLRCTINPEVGHELDTARLRVNAVPVPARTSVAVVGGGPAGLEFARRAAERGRHVRLFEAGDKLGGQLLAASRAPGRGELADFANYQRTELRRLGVTVHLAAPVDDLSDVEGDVVVVATGATGAGTDPLPVPAASVWDVVHGPLPGADGPVLLLDDGRGEWASATAALLLAAAGRPVTMATAGGSIVAGIPAESAAGLRRRLRTAGVRWILDATYMGHDGVAAILCVNGTGDEVRVPAAAVIVESGRIPVDRLWRDAPPGRIVHAIGDARTPRTIGNAVRDAMVLDRRLGTTVRAA
jgi:2,4-dienoyl-CoA reductase (NADPH2)